MENTTVLTYRFKNGITLDFTISKVTEQPILKTEWSCEVTRKNISPLLDEYVNNCVPTTYQQIATFSGQSILWIAGTRHYPPQGFEPQKPN